jgi:hypothetical protein
VAWRNGESSASWQSKMKNGASAKKKKMEAANGENIEISVWRNGKMATDGVKS